MSDMETQRLRIERLSYSADSIAHLENGKVCFVAGGCPGDLVEAHINQEKKGFAKATVTQVLDPGEARVKSPCPYAGVCGGCPWQHVDYDAQLAAKRANLLDALMRIGGFDAGIEQLVDDTLPSPKRWGYRNKVELEVKANIGGKLALGMHGVDGASHPSRAVCCSTGNSRRRPTHCGVPWHTPSPVMRALTCCALASATLLQREARSSLYGRARVPSHAAS